MERSARIKVEVKRGPTLGLVLVFALLVAAALWWFKGRKAKQDLREGYFDYPLPIDRQLTPMALLDPEAKERLTMREELSLRNIVCQPTERFTIDNKLNEFILDVGKDMNIPKIILSHAMDYEVWKRDITGVPIDLVRKSHGAHVRPVPNSRVRFVVTPTTRNASLYTGQIRGVLLECGEPLDPIYTHQKQIMARTPQMYTNRVPYYLNWVPNN
jgi:hypothetical protein